MTFISSIHLYHSRVYTCLRTQNEARLTYLPTSFIIRVYTRAAAQEMEQESDKFDKVLKRVYTCCRTPDGANFQVLNLAPFHVRHTCIHVCSEISPK